MSLERTHTSLMAVFSAIRFQEGPINMQKALHSKVNSMISGRFGKQPLLNVDLKKSESPKLPKNSSTMEDLGNMIKID